MPTRKIKSVKGRVMRLTRLDECGNPAYGECTTIVTDGFVSVTLSDEVEAGEEYTQKNAWGDFCIAEKDADRRKWVNVTIAMCEVDPEVLDLIGGADTIVDGVGDVIGVGFGRDPNPNAFAIEVWTKKAGGDACAPGGGAQEWGYFLVPNVTNGSVDGDITIENGPLTMGLKGEGQEASTDWATTGGPYTDKPLGPDLPGDLYFIGITTVQPPDPTEGCESLAEPLVPTITTVTPNTGPAAGGTAVTIAGTNFTGATGVTFDGVAGTAFSVTSAIEIAVTTPAGTVGPADVVVTHPSGDATSTGGFTYS